MYAKLLKDPKWWWVVYLIPNLLTTGNLFSGLFAILAVFHSHYQVAATAIMVALIFDILDGKSARWTNSTSQFGVEYDSLADLVSFGVAPGLLMYGWSLDVYATLGPFVMFVFVAGGALRLARFNVMTSTGGSQYFTGLPIPAAASVIATLVIFDGEITQFNLAANPAIIMVLILVLAFMMVSTIKYRNFKNFKFNGLVHLNIALLAILTVLASIILWPQIMFFVLSTCYAASGPIGEIIMLLGALGSFRSTPPTQ